ncbi:MAG TPA: hypothetical protein VF510_20145 [Ktedonobacterales bacterium]
MKRRQDEPEYPGECQKYQEVLTFAGTTPLPPYLQSAATSTSRRE